MVYSKVVSLLLEGWNRQRGVKRKTNFGEFEASEKLAFLSSLSYVLMVEFETTVFEKSQYLEAYENIREDFGLPKLKGELVEEEIETHTGLFVRSGSEQYEFAHKSLQEYLTAEYIVRLPSIPEIQKIGSLLPNEMAIAVSISSKPSRYFCELIFNELRWLEMSIDFYDAFISRLILERPELRKTTNVIIAIMYLFTIYISCRPKKAVPDENAEYTEKTYLLIEE